MFGAEPMAADDIHPDTRRLMEQFAEPMHLFNDEEEELELESSHPRKRMKKDEPEKEEKYLDDKEINDRIQKAGKPKSNAVAIKNEKFLPPPKDTIVDSDTIQIAACMSQQIYSAGTEEDFKLKTETGKDAKVVLLEKGRFNPAVPAFAMATFNKTLIIAFRGTNQILDIITDVSFAPVSSPELGAAAKGIRCHAAMAGLASR